MPNPPKNARPYGKCPHCGKKSRAAIYQDSKGVTYVKYVSTARPHIPDEYRKEVYTIRLSRLDIKDLEAGRKRLTFSNSVLHLQYKT